MISNLAKFFAGVALAFGTASISSAQDLIAMQAPVDRHTKVVDSLHLMHLLIKENKAEPAIDLYNSWNTASTHCYAGKPMPREFKIDLRDFVMPTTHRRVTSKYGYRRAFRRYHKGIDIKVYVGDTIRAAFSGKIRRVAYERRGYGKYVVIRHPNGLETFYAHMSKHLVKINDEVKAGQPIGLGGNTGRSTGSHLHFECRLLGEAINPALLFDFPNQDVTGDYYVYRNPKGVKTEQFLARQGEESEVSAHIAAAPMEKIEKEKFPANVYRVNAGEKPRDIARRLNISFEELCHYNNFLTENTTLKEGQVLRY